MTSGFQPQPIDHPHDIHTEFSGSKSWSPLTHHEGFTTTTVTIGEAPMTLETVVNSSQMWQVSRKTWRHFDLCQKCHVLQLYPSIGLQPHPRQGPWAKGILHAENGWMGSKSDEKPTTFEGHLWPQQKLRRIRNRELSAISKVQTKLSYAYGSMLLRLETLKLVLEFFSLPSATSENFSAKLPRLDHWKY